VLSHQCGHFTAVQEGQDVLYSQIDPSVKYPGSLPATKDIIMNVIREEAKKADELMYKIYLYKRWLREEE